MVSSVCSVNWEADQWAIQVDMRSPAPSSRAVSARRLGSRQQGSIISLISLIPVNELHQTRDLGPVVQTTSFPRTHHNVSPLPAKCCDLQQGRVMMHNPTPSPHALKTIRRASHIFTPQIYTKKIITDENNIFTYRSSTAFVFFNPTPFHLKVK